MVSGHTLKTIARKLFIMKKILKLLLSIFLSTNIGCYAQYLVQIPNDAHKIKTNEKLFIGKPLHVLLKEIKPAIKMAYGDPSINIQSKVGYFRFNFINQKRHDSLDLIKKIPTSIKVYVKENFDWDYKTRPKGKEFDWTKEDEKKYGGLTIIACSVYGED